MELLQLKYFLKAAEKENISAAAKAFMVPPSGVSAAIKKLETELGVQLFDRTANSLRLNADGRIFRDAVEKAAEALQNAKATLKSRGDVPSGEVRLLILTNRSRVTERISEFKKQYPAVSFSIQHTDSGGQYGDFDVICADRQPDKSRFSEHPFVREEICLAVHRDNPLARKEAVHLSEAAAEKFISMPRGTSLGDYMERCFRGAGLSPACVIACDDPYYICEYLKMGLGVTFFPAVSWQKRGDAQIKLLHFVPRQYRESFVYVNKFAPPAARLFAEKLEKNA